MNEASHSDDLLDSDDFTRDGAANNINLTDILDEDRDGDDPNGKSMLATKHKKGKGKRSKSKGLKKSKTAGGNLNKAKE